MTTLIITNIKGSKWDINQDIITAVIANAESNDFYCLLVQVKNPSTAELSRAPLHQRISLRSE